MDKQQKVDLALISFFAFAVFSVLFFLAFEYGKFKNPPAAILYEVRSKNGNFYFEEVSHPWNLLQLEKTLLAQKQVIVQKVAKYNTDYNKFTSFTDSIVLTVSQSEQMIADEKYRLEVGYGDNTIKLAPSAQMHYEIIQLLEAYNQNTILYSRRYSPRIPMQTLTSDATGELLALRDF